MERNRTMTKPAADHSGEPAAKPRRGRPPAAEAGQVEERILETATALFLEQGFGRTTLDQVAEKARSGKSTLYGRYPNKQALFSAVVRRSINTMFADLTVVPSGRTARDRLRHVGTELVRNGLLPRCVAFIRITAAEAENFPELARMGYDESFQGCLRCIAEAITGTTEKAAIEGATPAAVRFMETALHPLWFQAVYGADPAMLMVRGQELVDDAVMLLEAKGLLPD